MIQKLNHKDYTLAQKIRSIFQASYAVEAELLKANDFPPLKRQLESFLNCENMFFGYYKDQELVGVIEVYPKQNITHIQSLVVHPSFFRQGIAQALINFVFQTTNCEMISVETGVENTPAINLYQRFGFRQIKQWDTDHGVRKVRFTKHMVDKTDKL